MRTAWHGSKSAQGADISPAKVDAACLHGLDPDTRLLTTANSLELPYAGFITPRPRRWPPAQLLPASTPARTSTRSQAWPAAGRRPPVAILSETTRGQPERSAHLQAC
jgi:hypothetical protein